MTDASPQSESGDPKIYRGKDRRRRPTPMLSRYSFFGGRRGTMRRGAEREGSFVDLYEPRLALLVCAFFFLTVLDSVSTVIYIRKGGSELNPIAQVMLDQGDVAFVLLKGGLTLVCALFVLLHKNFRYANAALSVGFAFYFALAIYHMVLQLRDWNTPMYYGQLAMGPAGG